VKLVIIESPYAGKIARNTLYAQACLLDCLGRDEAPLASHLLYPQVLDDTDPAERKLGIDAGLAWRKHVDYAVFYEDFGWSTGMKFAAATYLAENIPTQTRTLPPKVLRCIEIWEALSIRLPGGERSTLGEIRKEYGW
jgi:hypothetical protein